MRKSPLLTSLAAAGVLGLVLTGCGTASDPDSGGGDNDTDKPLTVAASPTPHAEILSYVQKNLAEDAGLDLKIREFSDYVLPNNATETGEVDANFFQHKPYLDDFNKKKGTHIEPVVNVELEPLALYSEKIDDLKEIGSGQTIAVPNDATNEGRALHLLDENELIELKQGTGQDATLGDIADDKGLQFKELEAPSVPRALSDVDAAVINGNYALQAKLNPNKDALVSEEAKGNPYANFLAVKKGNEDDPRVRKLAKLLNSDEVKKYIEKKYRGAIEPVFGAVR